MRLLSPLLALTVTLAAVSGHIQDRTTAQPMPGLRVAIGNRHATTDTNGRYLLTGVPAGRQTLTVQSNDVPAQRFRVTVKAPSTQFSVRVCSMTLDYNCSGLNGSPNSD